MDYSACSGSTGIKNSETLTETIISFTSMFRSLISIQTILNYLERNKTKVMLILLATILWALQCFSGAALEGICTALNLRVKWQVLLKKKRLQKILSVIKKASSPTSLFANGCCVGAIGNCSMGEGGQHQLMLTSLFILTVPQQLASSSCCFPFTGKLDLSFLPLRECLQNRNQQWARNSYWTNKTIHNSPPVGCCLTFCVLPNCSA